MKTSPVIAPVPTMPPAISSTGAQRRFPHGTVEIPTVSLEPKAVGLSVQEKKYETLLAEMKAAHWISRTGELRTAVQLCLDGHARSVPIQNLTGLQKALAILEARSLEGDFKLYPTDSKCRTRSSSEGLFNRRPLRWSDGKPVEAAPVESRKEIKVLGVLRKAPPTKALADYLNKNKKDA